MRTKNKKYFIVLIVCFMFCLVSFECIAAESPYIIKLNGDDAAEFRISNIKNLLSSTDLSDEFLHTIEAEIKSGEMVYYKGPADSFASPGTPWINVALNQSIQIDVSFNFTNSADNRFQGVPYKLNFEFEAKSDSGIKIQLAESDYMYSNLNINPGDLYGFSIIVKNEKQSSDNPYRPSPGGGGGMIEIPPFVPAPTPEPSPSPDSSPSPQPPPNPIETLPPENSGENETAVAPGSAAGSGIKTGDYSEYITATAMLPLLVTACTILFLLLLTFSYFIYKKRRTVK